MKSKGLKIIVLIVFLGILVAASWYLWNHYVVRSPYHQKHDGVQRTD